MSRDSNEDQIKHIRDKAEYVILFLTAGISIVIAVLDLIGALDASSWITQRIPTLTLLGIGFVASYLIIERRGKLDYMTTLLDRRTDAILKIIGVEVTTYENSGDLVLAFATRLRKAKRIDDITWNTTEDKGDRWSGQDITAYKQLDQTASEVFKKSDIIWREILMFSGQKRFEKEKQRIFEPNTPGYNVGYYDAQPDTAPPRIGFSVIDRGTEDAEVFLSSSSTRLSIKHPTIVAFFAEYFELAWDRTKKLKQGTSVNKDLIKELETQLAQQANK